MCFAAVCTYVSECVAFSRSASSLPSRAGPNVFRVTRVIFRCVCVTSACLHRTADFKIQSPVSRTAIAKSCVCVYRVAVKIHPSRGDLRLMCGVSSNSKIAPECLRVGSLVAYAHQCESCSHATLARVALENCCPSSPNALVDSSIRPAKSFSRALLPGSPLEP